MERIIDDSQEKQWGMFTHLAAFATFVFPLAGNIIGPLIIYLIKKDEYAFVNDQGKEVLNFQITWWIIFTISALMVFAGGIGLLMLGGFGIAWLVLVIKGIVAANNGQFFRYPLTIRFIQ
jgi:uncharacterized Tic20 family protein